MIDTECLFLSKKNNKKHVTRILSKANFTPFREMMALELSLNKGTRGRCLQIAPNVGAQRHPLQFQETEGERSICVVIHLFLNEF